MNSRLEWIRLLFVLLAAGFFVLWIAIALTTPRREQRADILAELHHGRWLRWLALLASLTNPVLMAYVVWFLPWMSLRSLVWAGSLFTVICLLGGLLLLEAERVRIYLTSTGIICRSPWTGRRELAWSAIESITYSRLQRWFLIQGPKGSTLRVSSLLVGLPKFYAAVRGHIPFAKRREIEPLLSATSIS